MILGHILPTLIAVVYISPLGFGSVALDESDAIRIRSRDLLK
jgi:hypothetical protein